ncbi:unnamed protein product [Rotaria magnacalcarata]|uniref:Bromo domain-containing protein n=3 Tax=Rotaria magnacalcarata TaxID=392030 RepID=A0A815NJC6_9BILA|nr:unnamed protein product [Rotaria magnacalcarata]CAF1625162.1 unnamed protein product [Rotaria magnacalcarata]CAF2092411.1 unnamed protein product [Rotaria magnacalcarata]CAF2109426.1 unnamed protein product [Rotaria magnacalcarata]CAF2132668.1 unnamed protein product [Rotaria magnacalcarata]
MATDWTTKEKIILISDILEHGDQPESWSVISTDLSRTFQTTITLSQTRKEGRYSIKNCKQEYKYLVNRYKTQWTELGSSNGLKLPLAKYIWIQLKSIYQAELTHQLNESRKKLTEFCLRLESAVNIKSNMIEPTPSLSAMVTATPLLILQENEPQEEKFEISENTSQPIKEEPYVPSSEPQQSILSNETTLTLFDSSKETITTSTLPILDEPQVTEVPHEITVNEIKYQPSLTSSPNSKQNLAIIDEDISQSIPIDSPSMNTLSDLQPSITQTSISIPPSIPLTNTAAKPESVSSSRSTSRTSSETKTDVVKIIPTTTPKYHVYFSPKNSISNNLGANKMKSKRKTIDEIKDENETELINQPDLLSSSTEQSKVLSSTAPMTRRSINTRSVPNTATEQEEEKLRRFSAMLSENPNSWQSQSMAIIQFILAHKQGYLFEHEITEEIAPKYHQYVKRPIALDTIRKILESNEYQTKENFKRDIYLMLYNAMKYNPRYHHVHRSAKHLFNVTLPFFNLSAQEIQEQIAAKSNIPLPTTTNDIPLAKRKRTK